jgi:hypothetical protein
MSFNINYIKSIIDRGNGPARENTFRAFIVPPRAFTNFSADMTYLCDSAELPGRQMLTTPQVIYGAQRKMPYGAVYNDLSLTFICTNLMLERKSFEAWQSAIQDPTNNFMNYYHDYIGHVTVVKYNDQDLPTHAVMFEEAYPVTIEPQQLSWQPSSDRPLGLRINFAYLKWRSSEDVTRGGGNTPGYTPDANAIPRDFNEGSPLASSPLEFPKTDLPIINRPEGPRNPLDPSDE